MRSFVLWAMLCGGLPAQEGWSRFRGPNGSGVAEDSEPLPVKFGPDSHVVWKTDLPFGRSSPVLTADVIYLTAQLDGELTTFCIERDSGEVRWERSVEPAYQATMYAGNDSGSSTPVTDGVNVYCFFHELGLISYDDEGEERWRRELGLFHSFYGVATSPVLDGGVLVMVCDQVGPSFIVAVNKDTGEELWRRERRVAAESWATPLVREAPDGHREVLVFGTFEVHAYDVETGAERWARKGFGYNPISSPILTGDQLIVSASSHGGSGPVPFSQLLASDRDGDGRLTAIELKGSFMDGHFGWIDSDGDGFAEQDEWDSIMRNSTTRDFGLVSINLGDAGGPDADSGESWRHQRSVAEISSPLCYQGVIYMVAHGGVLSMLDAASGEVLARERIRDSLGEVFPSPVAADGKVYVAANAGTVSVLKAGRTFELLEVNDLGEEIRATPAISGGCLYVRTGTALYCFAGTGEG